MPEGEIVFHRRGGMYVANWQDYKNVFTTTLVNPVYTKAEEARAKQAYNLL